MNTQDSFQASQRTMVHLVAMVIATAAVVLFLVMVASLTIAYNFAALVIGIATVVAFIGAFATLALLKRRPLVWAVLPLLSAIFLVVVTLAAVLHDLQASALPFLLLVIVLVGMMGQHTVTMWVIALCSLIAGFLFWLPPLPFPVADLGIFLSLVKTLSLTTLMVAIGLMLDRFVSKQQELLLESEQARREAEQARREAEQSQHEAEQRKNELQRTLDLVQELELPVVNVGQGILLVPLIGSLDSRRLAAIEAMLLNMISQSRASRVVFDLTGINDMDSYVASGLIRVGKAARLLGARTFLSGVQASVAQTLGDLQVSLGDLQPVASLHDVLAATP